MYDIMVARATPCQSGVNWVTKHAVRNTNPIFFRFQIKFKGFNSNAWSPYDHTVRASSKHRNSTGAQITQLFPSDWAYYNFRRKNLVDKLHIRCAVKFILFLVDLAISYSQSYNDVLLPPEIWGIKKVCLVISAVIVYVTLLFYARVLLDQSSC